MTNQHPITPPPELLDKWEEEWHHSHFKYNDVDLSLYIAAYAAQWGADQELKACVEWLADDDDRQALQTYRRPKPPSLKEQALNALGRFNTNDHWQPCEMVADFETIRRALEALPE
jgi:hypothetical protein